MKNPGRTRRGTFVEDRGGVRQGKGRGGWGWSLGWGLWQWGCCSECARQWRYETWIMVFRCARGLYRCEDLMDHAGE
eukprot:763596-Hanusia_phi.AAC.3